MSTAYLNTERHFSPEDLKDFKRDLLATVFNESHAELLLYQKSRYLKTAKTNRTKSRVSQNSVMPSAEILDDIKFDKELDALMNIYNLAYETLTNEGENPQNPYQNLLEAIEAQKQNTSRVDVLINELAEDKSTLKHLKDEEIKQQNEFTEKLEMKKEKVATLRDQLSNIKRINRLELRLVEKWEDNRLTQAKIVGEKAERQLMEKILELQRSIAGEQRLICEIKKFRSDEMSQLKKQIADWEIKFKEEKNQIILKNSALQQNIADVVKSHEKHHQIVQQRRVFVAAYLLKKAEEQRLYEEQCHRVECAIHIQAWWRGVMVRKCLGPYRKKSKKSKKSKNKNK